MHCLAGTCKLNSGEPEVYLRYVIDVIANWPGCQSARMTRRLPGNAISTDSILVTNNIREFEQGLVLEDWVKE